MTKKLSDDDIKDTVKLLSVLDRLSLDLASDDETEAMLAKEALKDIVESFSPKENRMLLYGLQKITEVVMKTREDPFGDNFNPDLVKVDFALEGKDD